MAAAINTISCTSIFLLIICLINFSKCEEHCYLDIDCDDCYPEYLPDVTTHDVRDNTIEIPHGDKATFHCHRTKLKRYPDKNHVSVYCRNGSLISLEDQSFVHTSEVGCSADYFEDVQHYVHGCGDSNQGRSYQYFDSFLESTVHLAEICHDPVVGRTVFGRMTLSRNNSIIQDQHEDKYNKISMLESFRKMTDDSSKFDAEKVFSNDEAMFRRMKHLLMIKDFNFAGHVLVAAKLLPRKLFYRQNGMVTKYISNFIPVWKNIADGNLKHIQEDLHETFYNRYYNSTNSIDIYVGTHGILGLPNNNNQRIKVYLKPGEKYPVPKYIYTLVHNKRIQKAVVIVTINNPFISISEIQESVFCSSMCNKIQWIANLRRNNNYERTTYGIAFCCDVHTFSNTVHDAPNILTSVPMGDRGFLREPIL